jgi:hypothetical protein
MIREFELDDLNHITPLEVYNGELQTEELIIDVYEAPGSHIKTLTTPDSDVLAIFGGLTHNHILTIWAYLDRQITKYPLLFHRSAKKLLNEIVKETGVERVQSYIFANNTASLKQHIKLGFDIEGLLRKNGPLKQDEIILARVY